MKKKNKIIIIAFVVLLLLVGGLIYYLFTREDQESTLNLLERQWIENNKNQVIDFGLINNIAILNYSTDSLIFDFVEELEEKTGLDFNEISYEYDDKIKEEYSFKVVPKVSKKDILVYSDNYVLIGTEREKYNDLEEIKNGTIGVLQKDLDSVSKYLDNSEVNYKAHTSSYKDLLSLLNEKTGELDYIVMPKLLFLSYYEDYEELYVNYNITELKDNYVISLGKKERLNNILTKFYKKWKSEKYDEVYATEFTNMYYKISNTDEQSKVKFRSKRYTYGFVENAPFDIEINNKLYGMNNSILQKFSEHTNAEIIFKSYSNAKKLKNAFNTNKIDFMFNRYSYDKFDIDVYNTVSIYDEKIVIISNNGTNLSINSLNSLEDLEIATLADTLIEKTIKDKAKKVKKYADVKSLSNYKGAIALDEVTYNFYRDTYFKGFKVDYSFKLDSDYNYVVRDIKNNKVFEEFINYYLTYINEDDYLNKGYQEALFTSSQDGRLKNVLFIFGSIISFVVAFFLGSRLMPGKKRERKVKVSMKKEDKLKYVDMLTSLKNRNYLNDNIEFWDSSEVYPQSIIILDLNNIAYINDNYGHQEGDNVIKEAASILINNQIANSDIIRTNGNEFLIYLVGYDEKQVAAYIKKLNKELKELAHGFGAAVGYSMITDGIKTIDDAVNEATLDMRNNKEELNN